MSPTCFHGLECWTTKAKTKSIIVAAENKHEKKLRLKLDRLQNKH
jgi:hypothetical protein